MNLCEKKSGVIMTITPLFLIISYFVLLHLLENDFN